MPKKSHFYNFSFFALEIRPNKIAKKVVDFFIVLLHIFTRQIILLVLRGCSWHLLVVS